MILTKKQLKKIQENMHISISDKLENELLNEYGRPIIDDKGHVFEYTEQDIYEQVRKKLCNK